MVDRNMDLFEMWNLNKNFEIPVRSVLFPIQPIGVGTEYVESLTSYIARLAYHHNITTAVLINKVLAKSFKESYLANPEKHKMFDSYHDRVNGNGPIPLELVNALSEFTGINNLNLLTLLPWKGIFPGRMIRKKRAWCAHCLEEWHASNLEIYEPLIWYINCIIYCPIHNIPLSTHCPYCNSENDFLHSHLRMGYCRKCKLWMGQRNKEGQIKNEKSEQQNWILLNIGELLKKSPDVNFHISREELIAIINKLIDRAASGNAVEFARMINVSSTLTNNWSKNNIVPSFENLMTITNLFDTHLAALIHANIDKIRPSDNAPLRFEGMKKKKYTKVNREDLHKELLLD